MNRKIIYLALFLLTLGTSIAVHTEPVSAAPMVGSCSYSYDYSEKLAEKSSTWNDSNNKILISRIKLLNQAVYDAFYVMTPTGGNEKIEINTQGEGGYPNMNGARGGGGSFLLLLDPSSGSEFDYDTAWGSQRYGYEAILCASAQQGVTYTTDYSGGYDPFPSMPVTSYYSGTINCIDPANQPIYMYIIQPNNQGYATLSYLSPGESSWTYNLTDDDYAINVGCGSLMGASFGSVSPLTASGNWACNIYEDPVGCVLI